MQTMNNPLISVVSPEYKGAKMIPELVRRNIEALSQITDNFEIILVNDASPDDTWEVICSECAKDQRVKGINLSRNFGQHNAISAGLQYASGEWIVVMDCDLQDRPEEIPNLYAKAMEGWDIVVGRRVNKQFGFFKKLSSTMFHVVFDWLSGQKTDSAEGNFGIYNAKVIAEINKMPERVRSFGSLLNHVGFKKSSIDIQHDARGEGKSSYSLGKLLRLSFETAISNTDKPLKMAVKIGLAMSVISLCLALYNVIAKLSGIIAIEGYTTTVFSIWFVGGLLLFIIGIIGLYIGRIFDQVKGRQFFIAKDTQNLTNV